MKILTGEPLEPEIGRVTPPLAEEVRPEVTEPPPETPPMPPPSAIPGHDEALLQPTTPMPSAPPADSSPMYTPPDTLPRPAVRILMNGQPSAQGKGKGKSSSSSSSNWRQEPQDLPDKALREMDGVNLLTEMHGRVQTVQDVPVWFRGQWATACSNVLQALTRFQNNNCTLETARAWKCLLMLPRMLLRRAEVTGKAGKEEFTQR